MNNRYITILGLVCWLIMQAQATAIAHKILRDILIGYYNDLDCDKEEYAAFRDVFNEEESAVTINGKKIITISLGCMCDPAWYTRKYNIRSFAFPFDWCLTPYPALYEFIKTDFAEYFKIENLIPSSQAYFTQELQNFFNKMNCITISENPRWVLDKQYGMVYNHDFPSNSLAIIHEKYQEQYTKYMRRVTRFFSEINSNKHVYFIRFYDISKLQTYELLELLKIKFPKTNFTLIVIGEDPSKFSHDWKIPQVKNYYFDGDHTGSFWQKLCNDIASGDLE